MNKRGQIAIGILVVLGIIALAFVIYVISYAAKAAWLGPKTITTQIDSAGKVIEKTYDPDNAIYNYEWFKTQYEKIQAIRNQIDNTKSNIDSFKETYGNVSTWDYTTKEEYNRLNTIKIGLMNQEENLVAEYNARAKMANRNIFSDKLPFSVDKILW